MDSKAVNILVSTVEKAQKAKVGYWWETYMNYISAEDFMCAKQHLTMFDPVRLSHDKIFKKTRQAVEKMEKRQVVNAFLHSLSTRKMEYRSFLSSYCIGNVTPEHHFISNSAVSYNCAVCGACDILHDDIHFGYVDNYVTEPERVHRPIHFDEVDYPARWWQGRFGVDNDKWEYWFRQ